MDWDSFDWSSLFPSVTSDVSVPEGTASFVDTLGDQVSRVLAGDSTYSPVYASVPDIAPTAGGSTWLDTIQSLGDAPMITPSPNSGQGDILDQLFGPNSTLGKVGKAMESPGGKLAMGLGGAGIGALGAYQRNKLLKDAMAKQQQMLAERQALGQKYSSPVYYSLGRQAVATPAARNGASVFFTNNGLRSNMVNPDATSYFAEGGWTSYEVPGGAQQRVTGYIQGGSPGQDDKIDARLSHGEYVFDSDVVSALGDGNNEAGAKALDEMRENIRQHKRSAPKDKIPPKAKSPLSYMKKEKKHG